MGLYRIRQAVHINRELECSPNFISSIKYTEPLHCHDFYEFFLITSGRCLHRVNTETQRLSEGALVFVRPDDLHAYDYDAGGDCSFINVPCTSEAVEDAFTYLGGEPFSDFFTSPSISPCTRLSPEEKEKLIASFERLKVLCTIDQQHARLLLRTMLVEVLTLYFPRSHSPHSSGIPRWLETLLTQMQKRENFAGGLTKMEELSSRSQGYLNRVFRRYLGTTPTAYINGIRLDFAKTLLLTTELSIVDISMEVGFENLSHFYHLFAGRFQSAPAAFRKSARQYKPVERADTGQIPD